MHLFQIVNYLKIRHTFLQLLTMLIGVWNNVVKTHVSSSVENQAVERRKRRKLLWNISPQSQT